MSEPNFVAVWPIMSETMTAREAERAALADLPLVAMRHGHYWEPGTPVVFEFPTDGYESHFGHFTGDLIVAHTRVTPNIDQEVAA